MIVVKSDKFRIQVAEVCAQYGDQICSGSGMAFTELSTRQAAVVEVQANEKRQACSIVK